eukprot:TRINITY_DN64607_c0_g1_i1.p2 TRINITY_DN64607_c0_g1~~TRINITY_DN64607_c0_g1_i1.p2  ORF type:complete len:195 (-),score=49.56 TRINITY_DN64607_c0_g1_i1:159-743(-)
MAGRHVRFRISNIPDDLSYEELHEAFEDQLHLEEFSFERRSLCADAFQTGGNLLAGEVVVSEEEADILRGPYKDAKIFVRRTIILRFEERQLKDVPPPAQVRAVGDAASAGGAAGRALPSGGYSPGAGSDLTASPVRAADTQSEMSQTTASGSVAGSTTSAVPLIGREALPVRTAAADGGSQSLKPRPKQRAGR